MTKEHLGPAALDVGVSGWFDFLANVATVLGVIVAFVGGWIALRSYKASTRSAAAAHMHSLFRDYLKMRVDVDRDGGAESAARDAATDLPAWCRLDRDDKIEIDLEEHEFVMGQVAGAKLYALEEMFTWVNEQRREIRFWHLGKRRRRRIDIADAWEATIITHALHRPNHVIKSIVGYASCYSVDFLVFIAPYLNNSLVQRIANDHKDHLEKGLKRPLGVIEERQRSEAEGTHNGPTVASDRQPKATSRTRRSKGTSPGKSGKGSP